MSYLPLFLSSLLLCSCAVAAAPPSLDALSTVLNQRMLLMKEVATWKAEHHLPVEDLPREQAVLKEAREKAAAAGLAPQSVDPFMHALMNAGKAIQYRYLADWQSSPDAAHHVVDLAVLRQQIIALDSQLLQALHQRLQAGAFADEDIMWLSAQLNVPNLSAEDKKAVLASLRLIRLDT